MISRWKETNLRDLPHKIYRDLINELNDNSTWKKIAIYMVEKRGESRKEFIDDLERRGTARNARESPAELLLDLLESRRCQVELFLGILRECELLDALYIVYGEEDMEIEEQPSLTENGKPFEIKLGETLSLTCRARGLPPPKYQWFHDNNELDNQTSSTIDLLIDSVKWEGDYRCQVIQYNREGEQMASKLSDHVSLLIKPTAPEIMAHSPYTVVEPGKPLRLLCVAMCHPSPRYQWWKGNDRLDGQTGNILHIEKASLQSGGLYKCEVSNVLGTISTGSIPVEVDGPRQTATAKLALIIANSEYHEVENLRLPKADGALIANTMINNNFKSLCFVNLTLEEMKFIGDLYGDLLEKGAYGFYYFAGHGCSKNEIHMMPVDAPRKFQPEYFFPENELLKKVLKKKLPSFVMALDMCLTRPPGEDGGEDSRRCDYQCPRGLHKIYSTCFNSPSFESKTATNGLFATIISRHLSRNIAVHKALWDASADFNGVGKSRTSTQIPMITSIPSKPPYCYLTDKVTRESDNNIGAISNLKRGSIVEELIKFPKETIKDFKFPCGVSCEVKIGPLHPPYLNLLLLTTSGLEDWDVNFSNYSNNPVKLVQKGRNCEIHHPQRIRSKEEGSVVIRIARNGVHDSEQFAFHEYLPKILKCFQYRNRTNNKTLYQN